MTRLRQVLACTTLFGVSAGLVSFVPGSVVLETSTDGLMLTGATFLGGGGTDDAYEPSIAIGDDSSVYVSGFTTSIDFPVTPNAFDTTFNGGMADRFVSRFESGLSRMLGSTLIGSAGTSGGIIGGNGDELGHAIAIDGEGHVFIAGYTESADYPMTANGYDTEYNGGRDVFVSKFDSGLTTLLASTFVGGSGDEGYMWPRIDMTVTEAGDVVVAGITHSVDFPISASAYSGSFSGGRESGDAFVIVMDNDLSTLKASTYLGGSHNEWRISVHSLDSGGVLVCGETESSDFPTTEGAYDRTLNVIKDAFIARFDGGLSTLEASTLFGGSRLEEALDIDVSPSGEVLITGYTESEDFPVTAGSYSQAWAGGRRDGYAAKFDPDLSTLLVSTLFGGSAVDMGRGLVVDQDGYVFITGNTTSHDFPVTNAAHSAGFQGGASRGDAFLLVFDDRLKEMKYSSLFGGGAEDTGFAVEVDAQGNILIAGSTNSVDFPMLGNSFDDTYNGGGNDNFLLSFSRMR